MAKSFQSLLENLDDFDQKRSGSQKNLRPMKNPKPMKNFKEEHKSSLSYVQNLDLSEILPLLDGESDQSISLESAMRYDFDPLIFESASKSLMQSKA